MELNSTEQNIFSVFQKYLLNEERMKNDHILEYTIRPGIKGDKIICWWLNFYLSDEIAAKMKQLITQLKKDPYSIIPKENYIDYFPKMVLFQVATNSKMKEISLRVVNPENMIDDNGNIVLDIKTAPGKSVALICILYRLYVIANGGEKPSESLKSIIEDVSRTVKHKITSYACSDAVKSAYSLWKEFCEKLGSNEVQELIKNLSISYDEDAIIDHRLSAGNKLRALGQARKYGIDITYLATARNWRMMFNRTVNPSSHPIYLIVPWGDKVGKEDVVTFAAEKGVPNPDTMSAQQYMDAFCRANAINLPDGYGWAVYYDVSETTMIEGEDDTYNNGIGYENNLNGTPNAYTRAAMGMANANNREISNALYSGEQLDTDRALAGTQIAAKNMKTEVINPQGDNENAKLYAIRQMIMKMAEFCVVKQGRIIKPENANPIISYITAWVMLCMKMNPSIIGQVPTLDEKMNIIAYNYFQKIIFNIEKGVQQTYANDKSQQAGQMPSNSGAVAENGVIPSENNFKFQIPSFEEFCNGVQ